MHTTEFATSSTLRTVFQKSEHATICAPFFSEDGIALVRDLLMKAREVDVIMRMDILNWATGHANLKHMSEFVASLSAAGVSPRIFVRPTLHAKVYASKSDDHAYFGSANLTLAAFGSNIEVMTYCDAADCQAIHSLLNNITGMSLPYPLADFTAIVKVTTDVVEAVRKKVIFDPEEDGDFLTAVTLFSEELHRVNKQRKGSKGRAPSVKGAIHPDSENNLVEIGNGWPTIEEFISYCDAQKDDRAKAVVDRFNGASNLQGHINHLFHGALFFFHEHPEMINKIPDDLANRDRVIWSEEPWVANWITYLRRHENEFYHNINFSFHTLTQYLPSSLGGAQTSGGATSGNFKKIMPLLARMMKERMK